ncbi:hypothetical protein RM577_03625 [Mammaliicoccus sciuri]|uniref:hypothetical protein n=1 Tax=Mammaliicoccus sciuri TaxID=1296 RepID=UPI00288791DC|nr:hypothetical protein [Mammaliicoccus sciuri]MDT0707379.1 hypothetical protein [Mammaliicoccus sciuri]
MKKAWQVNITGPGDWNFNKDNFIGIEIKSDEYLNFEYYEDAIEFIDSINVSNGNTDNFIKVWSFISELNAEPGKKYNKREISIPINIVTEEVVAHYNEERELDNRVIETPYYEFSEGEEFLEVDKNKFE